MTEYDFNLQCHPITGGRGWGRGRRHPIPPDPWMLDGWMAGDEIPGDTRLSTPGPESTRPRPPGVSLDRSHHRYTRKRVRVIPDGQQRWIGVVRIGVLIDFYGRVILYFKLYYFILFIQIDIPFRDQNLRNVVYSTYDSCWTPPGGGAWWGVRVRGNPRREGRGPGDQAASSPISSSSRVGKSPTVTLSGRAMPPNPAGHWKNLRPPPRVHHEPSEPSFHPSRCPPPGTG